MYTGKVDHRWTDKLSSQGFYLYNHTNEPCANQLIKQGDPNAFAERNDYILKRRVHIAALNNTWLPSNNTVVTRALRLHALQGPEHAVGRLRPGRSSASRRASCSDLQVQKFPRATMTDYTSIGAIDPNRPGVVLAGAPTSRCRSWSAATPSRSAATTARSASTRSRSRAAPASSPSTASSPRRRPTALNTHVGQRHRQHAARLSLG